MDTKSAYTGSFSGFIDYTPCYHNVDPMWIVVGSGILLGTLISIIPQMVIIIKNRSSFGINSFTVFVTNIGQFLLVSNIICLHGADFVGLVQVPLSKSFPRMLTFLNTFMLWFGFLVVVLCNFIFFDNMPRAKRDRVAIRHDMFSNYSFTTLTVGLALATEVFHFISLLLNGYASTEVIGFGKTIGTVSALIVIAQYLPQMITTCSLKDSGSLSLLMLGIQAPGGLLNALFMWIGQGEDWTTWLSILAAAIQQFILLGICLYYKGQKRQYSSLTIPLEASSSLAQEFVK